MTVDASLAVRLELDKVAHRGSDKDQPD